MLFNSFQFILFFPIVSLLYFIIPAKAKTYWLLVCSYYFYMCWNAKYALLILTSTVVTYLCGLLLEKIKQTNLNAAKQKICKNWTLAGSLIINLGILFYFKYVNFTIDMLGTALNLFHIQLNIPHFDIILPVGISFYTFQALSYTMDVYRNDIYAEKNFFRYALFVSYFPQLVAGPIERSRNLLKQLAVPAKFSFDAFREGFLLMLWGFFLKIVLADRIALFVDTVYGDIHSYAGWYLIVATVLFAFQIYCDFAGYSTIAMGAAKIMGITLMDNFHAPYLSTSVSEFWRKWHISLTSWFKDYLYIPLGGSRKGIGRKYLNKMIVFLVSGLWHGAQFSFVIWGALNGLYQVIEEFTQPLRDKLATALHINRNTIGCKLSQYLTSFLLIDFSWIFFRADHFTQAREIIHSIMTASNPWILFDGSLYQCGLDLKNFWIMLFSIGILFFSDVCKHKNICVRRIIIGQDFIVRCILIGFACLFILLFGMYGPQFDQSNFVYFQF